MKSKKSFFAIIFFSLTAFFYGAELTGFSFEPEFGFLNGTIFENVWYADITSTNTTYTYTATTKLSRLDWQLENAPYFGANIQAVINRHLAFNFSFMNAISGPYGIMEDYDWKTISKPDHLTNYSRHTNYIQSFTQIFFNVGYSFNFNAFFPISITPAFGLNVFAFDFTGRGGYRSYEKDKWKIYYWNDDEIVIEYQQAYLCPKLALYADFDIARFFEAFLGLGISYIDKFNAYDIHEVRNEYFNDRIEKAWAFDANLKLHFKITGQHKLGLKATVTFMGDSYGFTYYSSSGKNNYSSTPSSGTLGGTSRFLWTYGLTYTFKF